MRKLSLLYVLPALLLIMGNHLIAQRGNTSGNGVIQRNYWGNSNTAVYCPETGFIDVSFTMHVIEKLLPNGKESYHANCKGAGVDEFGGKWHFHQTNILVYKLESGIESDLLYLDHVMLHGPNGKQLKMKVFILERDGNIVVLRSDPLCD